MKNLKSKGDDNDGLLGVEAVPQNKKRGALSASAANDVAAE
jgi:hypothetical protein